MLCKHTCYLYSMINLLYVIVYPLHVFVYALGLRLASHTAVFVFVDRKK